MSRGPSTFPTGAARHDANGVRLDATSPPGQREGPAPLAGGNRADIQNRPDHGYRRLAGELQALARDVRRIGCGFHSDPETIALAKDSIARRLTDLARDVERAR